MSLDFDDQSIACSSSGATCMVLANKNDETHVQRGDSFMLRQSISLLNCYSVPSATFVAGPSPPIVSGHDRGSVVSG